MERYEVLVVGAGPCGIAVGAAARKAGVSCVLFDKGCITNSIVDYPYYMTFFSTAVMLEVGGIPFTIPESKPTRREALTYYRRVVEHFEVDVHQYEEVVDIQGTEGDFTVTTRFRDGSTRTYGADALVIATGGFAHPNFLNVPGEDLEAVLPEQVGAHIQLRALIPESRAGSARCRAVSDMMRLIRDTLPHLQDPGEEP